MLASPSQIQWLHAVNTWPQFDHAVERARLFRAPVGLEVDIRVAVLSSSTEQTSSASSGDPELVLAHDASDAGPGAQTVKEFLHALASGRGAPLRAVLGVLKFDVKEANAVGQLSLLLNNHGVLANPSHAGADLEGESRVPLQLAPQSVWFNADVICGPGASVPSVFVPTESFPTVAALLAATPIGCGLSLGWVTGGRAGTAAYSDDDVKRMLAALSIDETGTALVLAIQEAPVVTFPVRFSFVRVPGTNSDSITAAAVTALRWLLRSVASMRSRHPVHTTFLTFWRARDEAMTAADAAWVQKEFPGSSVDFD